MKPTVEELERKIDELASNQRKILNALKAANILIPGLNSPSEEGSVYDRLELWEESSVLSEARKPE